LLGWLGAPASALVLYAEKDLPTLTGELPSAVAGIAFAVLGISLLLINWTRIWVKESREPFKYTFSVAEFEPGPETDKGASIADGPIRWLARDLTEKLGDRIRRLSFLDEVDVRAHEPDQEPEPHVHISGWYGLRQAENGEWWMEVVPKVRVGGKGEPAELGSTVHFKLEQAGEAARNRASPPGLDVREYNLLIERVYWAVASKIYAQIRRGVEQKALLLPPGKLRSAAYLNEAHDYARSNTLSAFKAARHLYRRASESYDRSSFERSSSKWRRLIAVLRKPVSQLSRKVRALLSSVIRRVGQREVRAAEAQLGYARMLVAEWHLRFLCGSIPKELYEAPRHIHAAIDRLEGLPRDIAGRKRALFRGYVTLALAHSDLQHPTGAKDALQNATALEPADAAEDSEFLLAEATIAGDPIRALRLLSRAVEHDPKHERARFMKAAQLEQMWRRQGSFEAAPAEIVDAEYAEVIGIDPGNVSAWANRGYLGWLLSEADPALEPSDPDQRSWRQRALSSLDAGIRYKEVRRDAMVGELNWSLARFHAEAGEFTEAYQNYLEAVSAMLGEPRMGFVEDFYEGAGEALLNRYRAYEERVEAKGTQRRKDHPGEERMIKSVMSFVLNDSGGAHYAFYRRHGDRKERSCAARKFRYAIKENKRFMLPRFNLALVEGDLASDENLPLTKRLDHLTVAQELLRDVIQIEQHWTFPRLRMAELEARSLQLQEELPGANASGRRESTAHDWLRTLLPHKDFRDNGRPGGRIDGHGAHVQHLLKSRIRWGKEFNEVQVEVLIHWVHLLADQSPKKAIEFSDKLQEVFYKAHPLLLASCLRAATELRKQPHSDRGALDEKILEWRVLQEFFLFTELRADPVHYANLNGSFSCLTLEGRKEIAARIEIASPERAVARLFKELNR
jgi:hypothetical protein